MPAPRGVIDRLVALATICLFGWIAITALQIVATLYLRRFRLDVEDNLLARKHVTQVRVLMGVADTMIILLTIGFALMTFDTVRQYGVSLFASAGIAGIVAGLAARPVLSNLFAGVQLAVTQPIRLEDAVTVENEYGWIEEITSTYVVIRLWDLRRLICAAQLFHRETSFYNWTRQVSANVGSVLLYLDYTAPIDLIRQKVTELAAKSADWNGVTANVQVTNARPDSIEVRVLASANSPAASGNLCADLREKLIAFLQQEHPYALPRRRNEAVGGPSIQTKPPPTCFSHRATLLTRPPRAYPHRKTGPSPATKSRRRYRKSPAAKRREGGNRAGREALARTRRAFCCLTQKLLALVLSGLLPFQHRSPLRTISHPATSRLSHRGPQPVPLQHTARCRELAPGLSDRLGQPVIVENRPGAGSTLGTADGAKATPDGYTVVMAGSGSLAISPTLYTTLPYDPRSDLHADSFARCRDPICSDRKSVAAEFNRSPTSSNIPESILAC